MQPELTADPRTGLRIVDIPQQYLQGGFVFLPDAVLHFFEEVEKVNHRWQPQKRLCVIGDSCLYLVGLAGDITRCTPVVNIDKVVIVDDQRDYGFLNLQVTREYDLRLRFSKPLEVLRILQTIYHAIKGSELPVERVPIFMQSLVRLTKPQGWSLTIQPVRTKSVLAKALAEAERARQERQQRFDAALAAAIKEIEARLPSSVNLEGWEGLTASVEAERARFDELEQRRASVEEQIRLLKGVSVNPSFQSCNHLKSIALTYSSAPDADTERIAQQDATCVVPSEEEPFPVNTRRLRALYVAERKGMTKDLQNSDDELQKLAAAYKALNAAIVASIDSVEAPQQSIPKSVVEHPEVKTRTDLLEVSAQATQAQKLLQIRLREHEAGRIKQKEWARQRLKEEQNRSRVQIDPNPLENIVASLDQWDSQVLQQLRLHYG